MLKIDNSTIKTVETIIKRLVIIIFIGVLIEFLNLVLNFQDITKGEKIVVILTVLSAVMKFSIMLIEEMRKSS